MLRQPPVAALTGSILLLILLFATARPAHAAEDCEAQLAFVRDRLSTDARHGRTWTWSWGIGYSAVALGQAGLAFTRDTEGEKAELFVGAGKSVLGLVPVFTRRLPALNDAGTLEARLAATPAGPERCALVAEATRMLEASADNEAFARGWLAHTLTVLVNAGGLAIVGFGYDRWKTGTVGALVGVAIGELAIWTRPAQSLFGRDEYRRTWTVAPMVESNAAGIWVLGEF